MSAAIISNLFSVSEMELTYRNQIDPRDRPKIISSQCAYDILMQAWDVNKIELLEEFLIMLLDRGNHCLGLSRISQGGVSYTCVDPKIIFGTAIKSHASAIILAHNHPSGEINPSRQDIALTEKLREGGKLLEVNVCDHLIVTPRNYYSFADEGLLHS